MNDELRVEDYETRLCALPSSRKAGVRPGRRKRPLASSGTSAHRHGHGRVFRGEKK